MANGVAVPCPFRIVRKFAPVHPDGSMYIKVVEELDNPAGKLDQFHGICAESQDPRITHGIAGHTEIVLHSNLSRVFNLSVAAAERGNQSSGGH